MGNTASSIASAIGSWLGGIAAHLLALMLAPIIEKVRQDPPPPHPLEARMDVLLQSVNGLSRQVELLREDLAARQDPFEYEMAMRAVPQPLRPRRQRHADDAV